MLFSSMTFLWIFLPLVLLLNWLLPRKMTNGFLVLASLFFYAWGEPVYILLMMFSIIFNWLAGRCIEVFSARKHLVLVVTVTTNLLLLAYFKYLGMLVRTFNAVLNTAGLPVLEVPQVILPIGISFFTFQALSYVVDVYRGEVAAQKHLLNVALYISFFPQLIAGPIVRYHDVNEQIDHRTVTVERFGEGVRRFVYGLGKKVLLSNIMAQAADGIFGLDISLVSGGMAWAAILLYTLQIYYDFSGYSDMAIGLGKMFGFDFNENFHYPYTSCSIREFWHRWHISLSTWFREYVYIPLGGNRQGTVCTYRNLAIVFFLTGLWHGASFSFVFWGLYHGLFQVMERVWLKAPLKKRPWAAWIYTTLVVVFGWVFFRIENFTIALSFAERMLTPWRYGQTSVIIQDYVNWLTVAVFVMGIIGMGPIQRFLGQMGAKWKRSAAEAVYLLLVFWLCIAALTSNTYNPFIYFKF